ncbi:MAG: alpha-glucan family phosphorylase [Gemmatimonadales bacterium]
MTDPADLGQYLPERIRGLADLASNLWWSWTPAARSLFRAIDHSLWHRTRHQPTAMLQRLEASRLEACATDPGILTMYDSVMADFGRLQEYGDTWFARRHPDATVRPIAYFCAEFALHSSIPTYSGGLGVLAGDHCKEASDLGVPLIGVGLFYVKGYFDQRLRSDGWQEASDDLLNPAATPLAAVTAPHGGQSLATLHVSGRDLHIGAWRLMVGRVPIYLLDTDLERNDPADRELTHKLYAGNRELRLRQEWVLGAGGVRVLRALGIDPAAWHANEGHAAFMFLERLRELRTHGVAKDEAVRRIRATSVFTTHTPVAAGHDMFPFEDVERCTGPMWDQLGVSRDEFQRFGYDPARNHGNFHMTVVALRLAGRVNAVAARHEKESRRIWKEVWPGRDSSQVPICHVTNGVHLGTWLAWPIRQVITEHLGAGWELRLEEPGFWDRVLTIDDAKLWNAHHHMRAVLHSFVREEARRRWRDEWRDGEGLATSGMLLSPTALTIGFARRFATYKRADLILHDVERLRRLLVNDRRPVQIVFAGKAHPADDPGKKVLQKVYEAAKDRRFEGRIAFLEDYEMHLAHRLVQGVDLWLNLPRVPLEACGTSGMKAALNGVPQLSTLDGWWVEGYTGLNGWAIPLAGPGEDPDIADTEQFFSLLESEVVPRYYDRDERDVPVRWVQTMKQAMRTAGERFTAGRMLREYVDGFYVPAMRGDLPDDDPPPA